MNHARLKAHRCRSAAACRSQYLGRRRPARAASVEAYPTAPLASTEGPIVVATDHVRAVPERVRAFVAVGRRMVTLGTDGFGRSDTRAALRRHFEVDAAAIVEAALRSLQ